MDDSTPQLAAAVRAARSLAEQTQVMRDRFHGRTCALVTCGPSLQLVPGDRLNEALRGVPTIAVKQAIEVVGDQADFHCWNPYNVSQYRWPSPSTIRCTITAPRRRAPEWNRADVRFPQVNGNGDLQSSLALSRGFGAHLIADDVTRPFGPGIMYELVIYLAVHLGCTRLITFGWDIADPMGKNTHYYDDVHEQAFFERGRSSGGAGVRRVTLGDLVPEPARQVVRLAKTRLAHSRGRRYNLTASLVGEPELVADSTSALAWWLQSIGVELAVVTDSPHLRREVPRLTIEAALAELQAAGSTGR